MRKGWLRLLAAGLACVVAVLLGAALIHRAETTAIAGGPPDPRVGPGGAAFWDAVPRTVPEGMKRGDIYWAAEVPNQPAGSRAFNLIYVSEGTPGTLQFVSGQIFVPTSRAHGARRVALWNHQTVGQADNCAPSRRDSRPPGVDALVSRGYVVVASDYQGLGVRGAAAYLDGPSQARGSLDALRAARNFPSARAGKEFVTYGWSQGGQTSLWVAHVLPTYAPEFKLLGASGIAPASRHLDLTLDFDMEAGNKGYLVTRMAGLRVNHPELSLAEILTADAMEGLFAMAWGCFEEHPVLDNTEGEVINTAALAKGKPWRKVLEDNDEFLPSSRKIPWIFFQGSADTAVPAWLTRDVAHDLCEQGNAVDYRETPGGSHGAVVAPAAQALPDWFDQRFRHKRPDENCREIAKLAAEPHD